jgi:hypothetical protein
MTTSFAHSPPKGPELREINRTLAGNPKLTSELNIKLWRHSWDASWSVEINEERAEFVTLDAVKRLVNKAVSDSKKSLVKPPLKQ